MVELYALCALLICIILVINTNSRMRAKRQKTIRLAQVVQSLRSLLEHLAMHRGMTNAYLKGDHSFESKITLHYRNSIVNGKSLLGILMLAAPKGAKIKIEAIGKDAEKAIHAILLLAEKKFHIKY